MLLSGTNWPLSKIYFILEDRKLPMIKNGSNEIVRLRRFAPAVHSATDVDFLFLPKRQMIRVEIGLLCDPPT